MVGFNTVNRNFLVMTLLSKGIKVKSINEMDYKDKFRIPVLFGMGYVLN